MSYLREGDLLYNIYDDNTNEWVTYSKVTAWIDGSSMDDSKCDGVIYRKLITNSITEYFKRNYTGPVNVRWFGAKGDGITDDTSSFQSAIDAFQTGTTTSSGADILIPRGTYLLNSLIVKNGTKLYAEQNPKDNYISNVPVTIKPYGNPSYIILTDADSTNWEISGLYIDGDYTNQPQLLSAVRLRGQKGYFTDNNINNCAQVALWSEAGLVFIERNSILGWFGNTLPTFTGINDFRGALHVPSFGDAYIKDNEVSASLPYFTSTVTPRDSTNGRIVAMSLGNVFGGTGWISGNFFENGDKAVALGNSLYCEFYFNRYELSAIGGLHIYGPAQYIGFTGERFSDNSLSVDGGADDIIIGIGAAGRVVFAHPTFELLQNGAIPNSTFKSRWAITNYGSTEIDLITPKVDPNYIDLGLVNNVDVQALPVRQVKGQYDPDNPLFKSVSTANLPQDTQVGYAKLKQGTDTSNGSFVGAIEFWGPDNNIKYSIGFSPEAYLSTIGYGTDPIFAYNGNLAINKNGECKITLWSLDGAGNTSIYLQGNSDVSNQAVITMNNADGDLEITSSDDIVIGTNENFRCKLNGLTYIPFPPTTVSTTSGYHIIGRDDTTTELVQIDPSAFMLAPTPENANTVYAGPTGGPPTIPTFRLLVSDDIPSLDASKITTGVFPGSFLGTGSANYIQNNPASLQSGYFWSQAGILDATLSIGTGTFAAYPLQVNAGTGISAQFVGRIIIPDAVNGNEATSLSQVQSLIAGSPSGTVTSVGLSAPSVFSVTGSPINSSGTLALSFATGQTANQVLASPDGSTGAVSLRSLVANDIPNLSAAKITSGTISTAILGSGTANNTVFLRGDNVWSNALGGAFSTNGRITSTIASEQLRTAYDASNYMSVTTGSTGTTTLALTGTSPIFTFNNFINAANGLGTGNTALNNLYIPLSQAATSSSASTLLFAGATNIHFRAAINGTSSTVIGVGNSATSAIIGSGNSWTTAASGTHALIANLVVNPLTAITSGGATVTATASLYVNGAGSGGSANYAIYAPSGTNRFDGASLTSGGIFTSPSGSSVSNFAALAGSSLFTGLNTASLLPTGATTLATRNIFNGTTATTAGVGEFVTNLIIGSNAVTAAASGVHPVIANVTIKAPSITTGASTITNASSLYIDAAPTGASNNWSLYVAAGEARFLGAVSTPGGFWTSSNASGTTAYTSSNLGAFGGMTGGNSGLASIIFAGATQITGRTFINGTNATTIPSANSAANLIVGNNNLTTAASGTHAVISNVSILTPTINSGGATVTNASSLYIDGAPTIGTNNWALYVAAGNTRVVSLTTAITTVTTTTTLDATHHTVIVNNSGSVTINLPPAASSVGRNYIIKKVSAASNDVIIDPNASETIDGVTTKTLTLQYTSVRIQSDGSNWHIVSAYVNALTL